MPVAGDGCLDTDARRGAEHGGAVIVRLLLEQGEAGRGDHGCADVLGRKQAGGFQGVFVYAAFAPAKRTGAFVAINTFDFGTAMAMAAMVNDLIANLAPR